MLQHARGATSTDQKESQREGSWDPRLQSEMLQLPGACPQYPRRILTTLEIPRYPFDPAP